MPFGVPQAAQSACQPQPGREWVLDRSAAAMVSLALGFGVLFRDAPRIIRRLAVKGVIPLIAVFEVRSPASSRVLDCRPPTVSAGFLSMLRGPDAYLIARCGVTTHRVCSRVGDPHRPRLLTGSSIGFGWKGSEHPLRSPIVTCVKVP